KKMVVNNDRAPRRFGAYSRAGMSVTHVKSLAKARPRKVFLRPALVNGDYGYGLRAWCRAAFCCAKQHRLQAGSGGDTIEASLTNEQENFGRRTLRCDPHNQPGRPVRRCA